MSAENGNALVIWYRHPASQWPDALPVGNGRLGAMAWGGARVERIGLDESTNWAGATAGIAEMLLQSHAGEIHLLPALPQAWPTGRVTGLCARGGYTVDMAWANGQLVKARITAREGGSVPVRLGGRVIQITLQPGESVTLNGPLE